MNKTINNCPENSSDLRQVVSNTVLFGNAAFRDTAVQGGQKAFSSRETYGLMEHLKAWSAVNPDYQLLLSALVVDIEEYSAILNSVSLSFGNYSLHDASHSKTIVRNIELMLGEEQIAQLSATDTWLILEAAYCHDLGMALTEEEINSIWKSSEFHAFLASTLLDGTDQDTVRMAELVFDLSKNKPRSVDEALQRATKEYVTEGKAMMSLGAAIRMLVAEFVRKQHAARSEFRLKQMRWLEEETYNGIPNRLYKLCGECALAHGIAKEDVISGNKGRLPKETDGYSSDHAHPRFVAMLLRLGDLFDVDNNRFNKYVIAAFGSLSATSQAHRDKHRCITHLLITPQTIEINADLTRLCDGTTKSKDRLIETYKATHSWFSWIAEELDAWHARGYEFIPNGFFYPAPPILKNRDIFIDGKQYDKEDILQNFGITYARAQEIFGSKPFYREPLSFVREHVQNAFDAYKFQIRYEWEELLKEAHKKMDHMDTASFQKVFRAILEDIDHADIYMVVALDIKPDSGEKRVRLAICDNGEGISRKAYQRMRSVGERGRRGQERNLIPGWLKPTGEFGIGLHSAFAVTNKINYRSFCPAKMDKLQMELTTDGGGLVVLLPEVVRRLEDGLPERKQSGTDVWFDVERKRLEPVLFNGENGTVSDEAFLHRFLAEIQRLLAPNIAPLNVYSRICTSGEIRVEKLIEKDKACLEITIPSVFQNVEKLPVREGEGCYYLIGKCCNGVWLQIITFNQREIFEGNSNNLCLRIKLDGRQSMKVSHKGSWITGMNESRLWLKGLDAELHILGRGAHRTVTTQRESLLPEAIPELKRDLDRALRCLLRYLAEDEQGQKILAEIKEPRVLQAFAMHFRRLTGNGETPQTAASAAAAIERIRDLLSSFRGEMEGYELIRNYDEPERPVRELKKASIPIADLACEDPAGKCWMREIREGDLSRLPIGLHPTVHEYGLDAETPLYSDIWAEYELDCCVDAFWMLRAGPSNTMVVRYGERQDSIPAETNCISFRMLLRGWDKQIRDWYRQARSDEPILYLPAVRLKETPELLLPLAVKDCDYYSKTVWKHFNSFVRMPILQYAERYRKGKDENTGGESEEKDALSYTNLEAECPDYLDALTEETFTRQLQEKKYSKEQIKQAYRELLKLFAEA